MWYFKKFFQIQFLEKMDIIFNLMTPNIASPKMPEFILLEPNCLLIKIMGTSTILNFFENALNFISIWKA